MIDFNLVPAAAVLPVDHSAPAQQSYDIGADLPPLPKLTTHQYLEIGVELPPTTPPR